MVKDDGQSSTGTPRRHDVSGIAVGEPTRVDGPIHLSPANARWPVLFEDEARRLREALGVRALRIEHVGSTSVPGLAAKPIIDVVLVVVDSSDEPAYVPVLEAAGYVLRIREPDWYKHRVLKSPGADSNVHVFSDGCVEVERMTRFRDRLRNHPEDRTRYEGAKRSLAARPWRHVQDYADAKSTVIEDILGGTSSATQTPPETLRSEN